MRGKKCKSRSWREGSELFAVSKSEVTGGISQGCLVLTVSGSWQEAASSASWQGKVTIKLMPQSSDGQCGAFWGGGGSLDKRCSFPHS